MKEISISELFEHYVYTLQNCGINLLETSDENIGYRLFEEFDIGATSFLHEKSLRRLKEEKMIDEGMMKKSLELREKFFALEDTFLWNIRSVKNSERWREILILSDEIKELLKR